MVYLDNAATAFPKAPGVTAAVAHYLDEIGANAGRSSGAAAEAAGELLFTARQLLANLIGAEDPARIIFTSNATVALNSALHGLLQPGATVLTSTMEHNSVMRPLRYLEKALRLRVEQFACGPDGYPDLADYRRKLSARPAIVICTGCSNVTGTIFPYAEMATAAVRAGAHFILDAAQLVGTVPLSLQATDVSIACFSGHKGLLGPPGTGAFYCRPGVELAPFICGGTGSNSASEEQPAIWPDRFESGTLNLAGIAGLKASLEFIGGETVTAIRAHEMELVAYFLERLRALDVMVYGPETITRRSGIIPLTVPGRDLAAVTRFLNENDITVRLGLQCAPSAHRTIGTFPAGTIRFSVGYFTSEEDIARVADALKEAIA